MGRTVWSVCGIRWWLGLADLLIPIRAPRAVKNAVVGYGGAEKEQVAKMVRMLLPGRASLK